MFTAPLTPGLSGKRALLDLCIECVHVLISGSTLVLPDFQKFQLDDQSVELAVHQPDLLFLMR